MNIISGDKKNDLWNSETAQIFREKIMNALGKADSRLRTITFDQIIRACEKAALRGHGETGGGNAMYSRTSERKVCAYAVDAGLQILVLVGTANARRKSSNKPQSLRANRKLYSPGKFVEAVRDGRFRLEKGETLLWLPKHLFADGAKQIGDDVCSIGPVPGMIIECDANVRSTAEWRTSVSFWRSCAELYDAARARIQNEQDDRYFRGLVCCDPAKC